MSFIAFAILFFKAGIIVGAAALVCYVIAKISRQNVSKATMSTFAFGAFLFFVFLNLFSFYVTDGGIDYRSLPVKFPVGVNETDNGTYITSIPSMEHYDIDRLSISRDEQTIFFKTKKSPDTLFAFNYATKSLSRSNKQVTLYEFDELYSNYHHKFIAPLYFAFVIVCFVVMLLVRKRRKKITSDPK